MPVDENSLPRDPDILQQMLIDLTRQLDKTQRLLQQLLTARSGTRSEQLSADQLRLFAQELGIEIAPEARSESQSEKDSGGDPPSAAGNADGVDAKAARAAAAAQAFEAGAPRA